jgi:hypothetical protein
MPHPRPLAQARNRSPNLFATVAGACSRIIDVSRYREQELSANDWTFFVFSPPIGEYELAIKTLDTSADPDYYLRWNSFPSLSKFDLRYASTSL